jgi:peroxiredoxin
VVQLGRLQEYYGEFQKNGIKVCAVSVDAPEVNARLKARLGGEYEFLSDPKGVLLDALDIRQSHASMTGDDVAIPTQYLVDRDGVVRWLHRDTTWRVRPQPQAVLQESVRNGVRPPGNSK